MKKIVFFAIFLLLVVCELYSQKSDTAFFVNTAFEGGEKLRYKVRYGLIKGGEASMTINSVAVGDTYLLHIEAVAKTTGVVGAMFTIYDTYESYVDIYSGYPVKSVRNIKENSYTSYNEVLFFREQGFLRSLKSGDHKAPKHIFDILSAFYYARRHLFSHRLKKDEIIDLYTFFDDEFFPIKVKFKNIEKVRTKFGRIPCLRFIPLLGKDSPFKKEEQFQVWVTADDNYIPVKIRVKLPVGSLKCDIIDFDKIKNINGQLRK
jgi:hypothetical protein